MSNLDNLNGNSSVLYVVATPIGNLEDITLRALRVLKAVDIVAAEDTRRGRQLFSSLDLPAKKFVSYYDAVEVARSEQLVAEMLAKPTKVAIISDAGTPCVSDPGLRLVAAARREGITVVPIPGVSALATIVSVSGLPASAITFVGFLPTKGQARKQEISSWQSLPGSVVFYESAQRLAKSLAVIQEYFPAAELCLGRELTKAFEEIVTIDIASAVSWCAEHKHLKGELTVMVKPGDLETCFDRDAWLVEVTRHLQAGLSTKDICGLYADIPLRKSEIYSEVLALQKQHKRHEESADDC